MAVAAQVRTGGSAAGSEKPGRIAPPGLVTHTRLELGSTKVHRTRLVLIVGAQLIGEALADRRNRGGSPRNRALVEANNLAFGLRLDFAIALGGVERLDGAK
jgi:hypothetical protein